MPYNTSELTPEERGERLERKRRVLAELIVEAMEACINEGLWNPKAGLAGFHDILEET